MEWEEIKKRALPLKTPLIFADGSTFYEALAKEYITHTRGLFVLAPSGAGKTYYIERQTTQHWIDGDALWMSARAQPKGRWWEEGNEVLTLVSQRSDVITMEAKRLGFWIMGASNDWLQPDGVVVPDWDTHRGYLKSRETGAYDGGATSATLEALKEHRNWILEWTKKSVPLFRSVTEAVDSLTPAAL